MSHKHDKTDKDWKKFKEENQHLENETSMDEAAEDLEADNALEHPSYRVLEEKLTLAEQQAHEHWEKAVRAMAELDNVRRRAERDVANAHMFSLEKFITALLPVADSMEHALELVAEDDTAMREGLELTLKLFLDALQKQGVIQLNPEGETFDPQSHEAMSLQESTEYPANTVLKVYQKGYKLHERVIRPARVIVTKS